MYAGEINRDEKSYIRVINTRDTDTKIVTLRVEWESLEKIAILGPKLNLRDHNISNRVVYAIASNYIPINRTRNVRQLLHLDHFNDKEVNHVNEIINN